MGNLNFIQKSDALTLAVVAAADFFASSKCSFLLIGHGFVFCWCNACDEQPLQPASIPSPLHQNKPIIRF